MCVFKKEKENQWLESRGLGDSVGARLGPGLESLAEQGRSAWISFQVCGKLVDSSKQGSDILFTVLKEFSKKGRQVWKHQEPLGGSGHSLGRRDYGSDCGGGSDG